MALPMPSGVVFSYNGFVFPSNVITTYKETPVYSEDNRMYKYSHVHIEVKGYITSDITTASGGSGAFATATLAGSSVSAITVQGGGSGYTAAPTVAISPPDLEGGTQATATAVVLDGIVVAVNVVFVGSGYTRPPTVTFTAAIPPTTTTDNYIENMRRVLSKPGKALIYQNKGIGGTSINIGPAGPNYDMNFGPKPGALSIKLLGGAPIGNCAAFFDWSIDCWPVSCTSGHGDLFSDLSQLAYTIDVSIDESGMSTITTQGNFEIPLSLQSDGHSILRSADALWEQVVSRSPPILGYRRTTRHTLSADRRRVDFNVVDTQLPGSPLPSTFVKADITMRIANQRPSQVHVWIVTISGEVTVNPLVPKADAFAQVYELIDNKINWARGQLVSPWPGPAGQAPQNVNGYCAVLILHFDLSNRIFSNDFSFSLSYRIAGSSIADVLRASGIWQYIGTRWSTWRAAMTATPNSPQSPGGMTQYLFNPANDSFVSLCPSTTPDDADATDVGIFGEEDVLVDAGAGPEIAAATAAAEPSNLMDAAAATGTVAVLGVSDTAGVTPMSFSNTPVVASPSNQSGTPAGNSGMLAALDPETTWLGFQCRVRYVEDGGLVRHRPLAGQPSYTAPTTDPLGPAYLLAQDTSVPTPGVTVSVPDIIQQVHSPSGVLIMEGAAMRIGYDIPAPQLVTYAGIAVGPPFHSDIVPEITNNVGGMPVHTLIWRRYYHLPTPPARIGLAANPWTGMDGSNVNND